VRKHLGQEQVVLALAGVMFVAFAIWLPNFLSPGNIINLLRSVSVLGMLGIGMAIVVIGRGIDLSIVATMAISIAWSLGLMNHGIPVIPALLIGLAFATAMGLITGCLVAYVEIPSLFATLAMASVIYGFGRYYLFNLDIVYLPPNDAFLNFLGSGRILGLPTSIVALIVLSLLGYLFLRYAKYGRFIYGIGDNYLTARITGLPVRPLVVLQYVISSVVAFAAGIITATSVASINTRVANSAMVYDVILIVILGGIGLSGGKGSIRNVLVGALLIGILLDGMTILDIQYTVQNVIKSLILLLAIMIDSILNPRDEQTSQQGDI
jgi:ribose transport system permease protein